MATKDPRIDEYIAKAQPFAKPILKKLRALVHQACPDVTETIKWGMPSFDYKGTYFSFAAFKEHCAGGFWKAKLLNDPNNYLGDRKNQGGEAMGNMGRITSVKDLPPDEILLDFLFQAKKLNEEGVKVAKPKATPKKELPVPQELVFELSKNKKARDTFENFAPSHRREYILWIAEAKTEATRNKRIETTVEWCSEGKSRNWKYERK